MEPYTMRKIQKLNTDTHGFTRFLVTPFIIIIIIIIITTTTTIIIIIIIITNCNLVVTRWQ
jgi:hypothetical protein